MDFEYIKIYSNGEFIKFVIFCYNNGKKILGYDDFLDIDFKNINHKSYPIIMSFDEKYIFYSDSKESIDFKDFIRLEKLKELYGY